MRPRFIALLFFACVISMGSIAIPVNLIPAISQTVSARKEAADRLLKQGDEQISKNQAQEALRSLQQALVIYQEIKDRSGEGTTLKSIGNAYRILKEHEKVITYQQQAYAISLEIKDRDLEARALNNIGLAYQDLNNPAKAIEFLQRSLTVSQSSQNKKVVMIALRNLGRLHNAQGEYKKAIKLLMQGLEIAKVGQDRQEQGYSYFNLAASFYGLAKYPDALNYLQQSAAIARERKDYREEVSSLTAIGQVRQVEQKYDEAIKVYQQALTIAQTQLSDKPLELEIMRQTALCYGILNKQSRTPAQLKQSIKFAEKLIQTNQQQTQPIVNIEIAGIALIAQAQTKLALYYAEQEEYELAQKYHLAVIETAQKGIRFIDKQAVTETSQLVKGELFTSMGFAYSFIGEEDQAIQALEKAIPLLQNRNKSVYLNSRLMLLSLQSSKDSTLEELNRLQRDAEKLVPLVEQFFDQQNIWLFVGSQINLYRKRIDNYLTLGDYRAAEQTAEKLVSLGKKHDRDDLMLSGLSLLQIIYALQGQQQKVAQTLERSEQIQSKFNFEAKSTAEKILYISQLSNIAPKYQIFGEIGKSIKIGEEALSKLKTINPAKIALNQRETFVSLKAGILEGLSLSYALIGDNTKSLQFQRKYITVALNSKIPELRFQGLISKARLAASERDLSQAIEQTQQAIALLPSIQNKETSGSAERKVTALTQLSQIFALQENYGAALEKAEEALQQAEKSNNPESLILSLETLAFIYAAKGDIAKSHSFVPRLSTTIQRNPNAYSRSTALLGLVNNFYSWGDYKSSKVFLNQAIEDSEQVQVKAWNFLLKQVLAQVIWAEGEPRKALKLLQEGSISGQSDNVYFAAYYQQTLAILFGELGQFTEATVAANKALKLVRKLDKPEFEKGILSLIGSLHRKQGQYNSAIEVFQSALAIRSSTDAKVEERNNVGIYSGLAQTYAAQNQTITAIAFYKKAVNSTEEIRQFFKTAHSNLQRSFLNATVDFGKVKRSDIYRQLADLLLSQGQVLEAQQVLELLKIQEIREFDRNTRAKISATGELLELEPTERSIIEKYGSYVNFIQKLQACQATSCSDLQKLTALREQAKAEYNRYIQDLNAMSEQLKNKDRDSFLDPRNPLSAKAIKLLENRPDAAVVYSLVTDKSIWFVVVTQGAAPRAFEVKNVSRKELSKAVGEFRQAMEKCQQPGYVCTTTDTVAIQQISQKLYRWLFPPELRKELPPDKIKHLMFSLDRNIRYIPMSALFDGKNYLIEKYAISTITTADRAENEAFSQTVQTASLLAMGASQFPNGLSPLPNVELELKAIVKTNPQDRLGIYPGLEFLNENFSKNNLTNSLPGRNILHLASHGIFSLRSPSESYISLGDRDRLSIPEIRAMTALKDIDLVVLSACQTALGGRENEDGVEIASMGSAFLQNNVKSVLASLWNVDDISTSLLMKKFYETLARNEPQKPITRAKALQQVQLQFLEGDISISDGDRLRRSLKVEADLLPLQPNQIPDFRHPYYWSPFVLMGSGF